MRLAVVEDEPIHTLEKLEQVRQGDVQPEVHGVRDGKFWAAHLVEHVALHDRGKIGEQDKRRIAVAGGQGGHEGFEHAKFGCKRTAVVHVHFVLAGPVEGLAGGKFEAGEVNSMMPVKLEVAFGKVGADDAHEIDGGEEAGRDGGVAGRAAEQAGILGLGGLDGVQRGGTDNHYAHENFSLRVASTNRGQSLAGEGAAGKGQTDRGKADKK